MTETTGSGHDVRTGARLLKIGDVSLFVDVRGHGYPLVVMHGGPSADHYTMLPFRQCADQFTVRRIPAIVATR